ncbi:MAG: YraN family protein [Bacteroidales bacterium]|nr:YraN family protein [Bacteroidales bacterium]HPD96427.1 YraN family protein [Tenuifilaceae bacterium]HRX32546.1 YraN family protein [Tenuifilaceae bacterium]
MSSHVELGKKGEDIAARYLVGKGYKILHRNWRYLHKELDIVATQNKYLVVVEVKTRLSDYWEEPKEAVRRKKQKNIIEAADEYVTRYNINLDVRFDIISILISNGKVEVEHIEDAFYPTL